MKQGKLVERGDSDAPKIDCIPKLDATYENGQKLRDAFEVIESSGVAGTITIELDGEDGLHVKAMNSKHSILSLLTLPRATFSVLEGGGPVAVDLILFMKALRRVRKSDSVRIGTEGRNLVVGYPDSSRQLTVPLSRRDGDENVPHPKLAWDVTLEVETKELWGLLKDLTDLDAETLKIIAGRDKITISEFVNGVKYEKEFVKDDSCVGGLDVPGAGKPIGSKYSLDQLKSVVSKRFETLTLHLGDDLPAKVCYSLDDMGSKLTVFVAPAP